MHGLRSMAGRAVLVLGVWSGVASGQPGCTVQETQRIYTVTGRFSFGSSRLALTLPHVLYRADPSVVYMQLSGSDFPRGLSLESGGEKVRIEDGAALHLSPQRNVRLSFSVMGKDGRALCAWATNVATAAGSPPFVREGFRSRRHPDRTHDDFRNAGDPIFLAVGGRLASESGEFFVDGLPATVLARNACQVILQDPRPVPGMRTIESRGFSVTLPFVVVELKLAGAGSAGRATLEIRVLGRDRIAMRTLPVARLALFNFDPDKLKVLCGRPVNYGDPRIVALEWKKDLLAASCKVRILKPGPASFDGEFMESGGFHRRPLLPAPWPRLPLTSSAVRQTTKNDGLPHVTARGGGACRLRAKARAVLLNPR
jgi:hypothetical protein